MEKRHGRDRRVAIRKQGDTGAARELPLAFEQLLADPLQALSQAALVLGLPALEHPHNNHLGDAQAQWVAAWRRHYNGSP